MSWLSNFFGKKEDYVAKLAMCQAQKLDAKSILSQQPKYAHANEQINFLKLVLNFLEDTTKNPVVSLYLYEHTVNVETTNRLTLYMAYLHGAAIAEKDMIRKAKALEIKAKGIVQGGVVKIRNDLNQHLHTQEKLMVSNGEWVKKYHGFLADRKSVKKFITLWHTKLAKPNSSYDSYVSAAISVLKDDNIDPVARMLLLGAGSKNRDTILLKHDKRATTSEYINELNLRINGKGTQGLLEHILSSTKYKIGEEVVYLENLYNKYKKNQPKLRESPEPTSNTKGDDFSSFIKPVKKDE